MVSTPEALSPIRLPHVVIVGGGFGGLAVARQLQRLPVNITLLDRRNFHLFQPLLYQVATGGLSPANISVPLRALFKRRKNVEVLLGAVSEIDAESHIVTLECGKRIAYGYLVVATGASHNYFGHPEWEAFAPGLKSLEDALHIRGKVLSIFERAELETDVEKQRNLMRFVVIGGGPTGVELAGALGEIAHQTLKDNFRHINPGDAEILLLEATPSVLSSYEPDLVQRTRDALHRLGVTVRERTLVKEVHDGVVVVESDGKSEVIKSSCVIWAAGVQASPLGKVLARQTGATLDKAGRLHVNPDLTLPNAPTIFVIGDLAHIEQDGALVPGVAPAAMQMGEYVAAAIRARLTENSLPVGPFQFQDKGAMATVGRAFAVVQLRRWKFSGFAAWITWLWVHIFYLTLFTNRLLVVIQWGWSYLTRNRSARLITD
jgi:NADH dehydrogenase